MKILITGGEGQLALAFKEIAPIKINNIPIKIFAPNKIALDITNEQSCIDFISKNRPDWIVNGGAFTNVDKAEKYPQNAYLVNGYGPLFLSNAIKKYGGRLIQISTDFVFDGKKESPYEIKDKRNPLNIYGKSKEQGEIAVEEILHPTCDGLILRTSWLVGPYRSNFLLTIIKLLKTKNKINVIDDQFGCPTSTYTLAMVIWMVIEKYSHKENSLIPYLHCCDDGETSWFKFALHIKDIAEEISLIGKGAEIVPIKTSMYNSLATRPKYSLLDNNLAKRKLTYESIHWEITIRNILLKILSNKEL